MRNCYPLTLLAFISLFTLRLHAKPVATQIRQVSALSFIENKGQIVDQQNRVRKDIQYKVNAPGLSIFVSSSGLHYQFRRKDPRSHSTVKREIPAIKLPEEKENDEDEDYDLSRLDVNLVGANKKAVVVAENKQAYFEKYYQPQYGPDGITAYTFSKITYKNIYPNIDWVLYIKDNKLEYDFVVRNGGHVNDIQLTYEGSNQLKISEENAICATTALGTVQEAKPYSYELRSGKEIASAFVLNNHTITFHTENYEGSLVIDPSLSWATYYGGSLRDDALGVICDGASNVYITGSTTSTSNIATTGAYQTTYTGSSGDAFLAKFTSSGAMQWATYFGGSLYDEGISIAIDPLSASVYLTGYSESTTGIATAGAHQTTSGGLEDVYLAKFSSSGTRLWATYYGGTSNENGTGVTCDASGNVYISGIAESATGIATSGSFQSSYGGGLNDGYIAKFNSAGVMLWGTYYGGIDEDYTTGIACDASGNVFVSGLTKSTSGIASTGSFQDTYGGGFFDGFLAKFTSTGTRVWATYYGGSGADEALGVGCDPSGNLFIAGITSSPGFTTIGTFGGTQDGFMAKFSNAGSLIWSNYYGSSATTATRSMACDASGNAFATGWTSATSGIATSGAFQSSFAGGTYDAYLVGFDGSGSMLYGTYFGGSDRDMGQSVASDGAGNVFITGGTASSSGISTTGSYQTAFGGGTLDDAYLAKFNISAVVVPPTVTITPPFGDTLLCPGSSFNLAYTATAITAGNTFTAQLSNATGSFTAPVSIGTLTSSTSGTIHCTIPAGTALGTAYRIRIIATSPVVTSVDNGHNVRITNTVVPKVTVTSSPSKVTTAGQTITFTATVTGGGSTPTFKWYKNGVVIPGATTNPYSSNTVNNGDKITVTIGSSISCATPDTATAKLSLATETVLHEDAELHLFPNPAKDAITIAGKLNFTDKADVEILNATGQIIYQETIPVSNTVVNRKINIGALAPGIYLLKVYTGMEIKTLRFVVAD